MAIMMFEQCLLVVWSLIVLVWFFFEFLVHESLVTRGLSSAVGVDDEELVIASDPNYEVGASNF
jgi:hypothetical protein